MSAARLRPRAVIALALVALGVGCMSHSADPQYRPSGSGWFCFEQGSGDGLCKRSEDACNKKAGGAPCTKLEQAYCMTWLEGDKGKAHCGPRPADCDLELERAKAEPNKSDIGSCILWD